jgi:hypothetical protein
MSTAIINIRLSLVKRCNLSRFKTKPLADCKCCAFILELGAEANKYSLTKIELGSKKN